MEQLEIPQEDYLNPGHLGCPGCGAAIAMKLALKALGNKTMVVIPACCWGILAGPHPHSSLKVPILHTAFATAGAAASIAFPEDMVRKFQKAKEKKGGSRFIHVLAACPPGWRVPSELSVKVSRLAVQANVFPLYEVEDGITYTLNFEGNREVKDYLEIQGRFKHLSDEDINRMQRLVDEDWQLLLKKVSKDSSKWKSKNPKNSLIKNG